jgi:hypothetical protein
MRTKPTDHFILVTEQQPTCCSGSGCWNCSTSKAEVLPDTLVRPQPLLRWLSTALAAAGVAAAGSALSAPVSWPASASSE